MLLIYLALCNLIVSLATNDELTTSHGTVVVVAVKDEKGIIAADSRGTNEATSKDDDCKISNYAGVVVVASAGMRSIALEDGKTGEQIKWDSHDVAKDAFYDIARKSRTAESVANGWDKQAKAVFAKILLKVGVRQFVSKVRVPLKDGVFSEAVFVDFAEGKARAFHSAVRLVTSGDGMAPIIETKTEQMRNPDMTVLGFRDVVDEFTKNTSKRAVSETQKWRSRIGSVSNFDSFFLYAEQLVVWSVEFGHNYPYGDLVGGPVGAAVVTSSGVKWLSIKSNCKKIE
jgi:hypothetical protein